MKESGDYMSLVFNPVLKVEKEEKSVEKRVI